MALRASNWDNIAERGGNLDNADFVILKCTNCGTFALYDEEQMLVFRDPSRLGQGSLYGIEGIEEVSCSSCGSLDTFVDTDESDIQTLRNSEWSFVIT